MLCAHTSERESWLSLHLPASLVALVMQYDQLQGIEFWSGVKPWNGFHSTDIMQLEKDILFAVPRGLQSFDPRARVFSKPFCELPFRSCFHWQNKIFLFTNTLPTRVFDVQSRKYDWANELPRHPIAGLLDSKYLVFKNGAVVNLELWSQGQQSVFVQSLCGTVGYVRLVLSNWRVLVSDFHGRFYVTSIRHSHATFLPWTVRTKDPLFFLEERNVILVGSGSVLRTWFLDHLSLTSRAFYFRFHADRVQIRVGLKFKAFRASGAKIRQIVLLKDGRLALLMQLAERAAVAFLDPDLFEVSDKSLVKVEHIWVPGAQKLFAFGILTLTNCLLVETQTEILLLK